MTNPDRRRRLRLLAKIIPVCVSLLVSLVAIELFARWSYRRPSMHFGMEMWKYAKTLKIRAENADMSYRHRPNASAFLMGVDMKINSLGLREGDDMKKEKTAGTYRIVVLGDSMTLGWGVPFEQLYPKLLEKSLNANPPSPVWQRYEVINTGVGNYNTCQEVASFKERWLALNPDMVLIAWYINDAEPTPQPSRNWLAYHSYAYAWTTANLDNLLRNVGANKGYNKYYSDLYELGQPGWTKSQEAFAELAGICRQRNISLHILLIPELHSLSANYEFKRIHELICDVGVKNNVGVLDLLQAFPAIGDPKQYWVSIEDAHPNGKANELMAAKLDATLRAEWWIKH
jgi:lysophospholipase L1-like esterase